MVTQPVITKLYKTFKLYLWLCQYSYLAMYTKLYEIINIIMYSYSFVCMLYDRQTNNHIEIHILISKSQNQVHMHTIPIDINHLGFYFGSLHKGPIKPNTVDAISDYEEDDDVDKQITEGEFRNILKGLNTNKAPGCDNIPAIVFKSFSDQLVTFTTQLFNNIFTQETFPRSWSIGKIKPLYKKGDPSNPKN